MKDTASCPREDLVYDSIKWAKGLEFGFRGCIASSLRDRCPSSLPPEPWLCWHCTIVRVDPDLFVHGVKKMPVKARSGMRGNGWSLIVRFIYEIQQDILRKRHHYRWETAATKFSRFFLAKYLHILPLFTLGGSFARLTNTRERSCSSKWLWTVRRMSLPLNQQKLWTRCRNYPASRKWSAWLKFKSSIVTVVECMLHLSKKFCTVAPESRANADSRSFHTPMMWFAPVTIVEAFHLHLMFTKSLCSFMVKQFMTICGKDRPLYWNVHVALPLAICSKDGCKCSSMSSLAFPLTGRLKHLAPIILVSLRKILLNTRDTSASSTLVWQHRHDIPFRHLPDSPLGPGKPSSLPWGIMLRCCCGKRWKFDPTRCWFGRRAAC